MDQPASVFLAGDPPAWSGDYAVRLDPSPEVRAVTDRFVGPGLNAVQGVALLVDEFDDDRLRLAELVHLSVPGTVDLSPARDSVFSLSEPARGEGRQRLTAAALGEMSLRAALLFLSRTEFSGSGAVVESDLGLVTAALEAGADAVIASLWPVEDEARGRFVAAFYTHLEESHDTAAALALTKRDAMREGDVRDWASFQLFLD
jgi:CHAT domain-containing protein